MGVEVRIVPLDMMTLRILVKELDESWRGRPVGNARRVGGNSFALIEPGGSEHLLFGLDPQFPHVARGAHDPRVGEAAPRLHALLRGLRCAGVVLDPEDRILHVRFGDGDHRLVVELIPHRPLAVLLDGDDMVKWIYPQTDTAQGQGRGIVKGQTYVPPQLPSPGSISSDSTRRRRSETRSPASWREALGRLRTSCPECGPFMLREALLREGIEPSLSSETIGEETLEKAIDFIRQLDGRMLDGENQRPMAICGIELLPGEQAFGVSPIPLTTMHAEVVVECDSLSEASLLAFSRWQEARAKAQERKEIIRASRSSLERAKRALEKVTREASDSTRADLYRRQGEILSTNMHLLKRGMSKAVVPDPFSEEGELCEIELDPAKSPAQNVSEYFRKSKRAARAAKRVRERKELIEHEIPVLSRHLHELEEGVVPTRGIAAGLEKLSFWRSSLLRGRGAIASRPWAAGRARAFRRFSILDGWTVLVGRNNRENDELTHRVAAPQDLWFHARGFAGSHVVLRREGKRAEPRREAIEQAARIAAHFSKGKHSERVPVVLTEKRYVRKPRGSPPGVAVCLREKVLFVEPGIPEQSQH